MSECAKDNTRRFFISPSHIAAAIIAVAVYALCCFMFFKSMRDMGFVYVCTVIPFMLFGAENIAARKSSLVLIIASFVCAVTSIEHFCGAVIIVMVMTLFRFSSIHRLKLKDLAVNMLLMLIPMLSGALLGAFAALPALYELITGGMRHFLFPTYDLFVLPPALVIGDHVYARCARVFGSSPRPYMASDPRRSAVQALHVLICCEILGFLAGSSPFLPGYRFLYEADIRNISEIPYEFPSVSSYSYYITLNDWESLAPGEQVEALHKSLVLDVDKGSYLPEYDAESVASLPGGTIVSDGTTSVEISTFSAASDASGSSDDAETYIADQELQAVYRGLRFTPTDGSSLVQLAAYGPDIEVDVDHDGSSCTVTYKTPGIYRYDSLDIVSRSSDEMYEEIWKLEMSGADSIETTHLEFVGLSPSAYPYHVNLTVNYEKPRLLLLMVPYSSGWSASLTGYETHGVSNYAYEDETVTITDAEVMRADLRYMAIQVPAGSYEITWAYSLPLFKQGIALSIISLIWVVIWLAYERSPKRYRYYYY